MKNLDIPHPTLTPLKPFWGIPPKIYVMTLGGFALFTLLWFLLPLLLRPQSSLMVHSSPAGTPVFWRGKFLGHTPVKAKITRERKGVGTLTLEREGFTIKEKKLLLHSWPFPLSFLGDQEISLSLELPDSAALIDAHLRDLSFWAKLGSSHPHRPTPPLFSDFVRDFSQTPQLAHMFLQKGLPLVDNQILWQDFWRAYESLFTVSFTTLWDAWLDLKTRFKLPQEALEAFYLNQSEKDQKTLEQDTRFLTALKELLPLSLGKTSSALSLLPPSLSSSFVLIPESAIHYPLSRRNSKDTRRARIPTFYLSRTPVTKSQLETFLAAHPLWQSSSRDALIEQGLVDENYLRPNEWNALRPSDPATLLSFPLAQAYVDWLNRTTLKGSGLVACLPTTFQWHSAILNAPKTTPFAQLALGVWYWMRDPHAPMAEWYRTEELPLGLDPRTPTLEVEIRSLENAVLNVNHTTPASLPRHWTAPHLSFYVVIQREEAR